jgi:glycosyltransferase involved in cell wall biosynthesis
MSDALITVGIPCFNAEETIEKAIRSALSQEWEKLEILVSDDVSTDKSRDIVREFVKQDSRVKLLERKDNGGPAATRNTLWKAAKGEYIAFFDDDDASSPERLKTQYERLSEYEKKIPDVPVCCYASGKRRYPNGYQLLMPAIGSLPNIPFGNVIVDYLLFNGRHKNFFYGSGTPACSLMISRSVLEKIGGFDENLRRVEDGDLAIRIGLAGGHFIGCQESLFLQYATSAPDKTPHKNLESELKMIEKYSDYLREKKLYYYSINWTRLRFYHFNKQYGLFCYTLVQILLRYPIRTVRHLLVSGPNRLNHEKKIASKIGGV